MKKKTRDLKKDNEQIHLSKVVSLKSQSKYKTSGYAGPYGRKIGTNKGSKTYPRSPNTRHEKTAQL